VTRRSPPVRDPELQRALRVEELRGKRDARYRANLACAGNQLRSITATIVITSSIVFGWPLAAHTILHRVPTLLAPSARDPVRMPAKQPALVSPSSSALRIGRAVSPPSTQASGYSSNAQARWVEAPLLLATFAA
jgi:hypothetical protein